MKSIGLYAAVLGFVGGVLLRSWWDIPYEYLLGALIGSLIIGMVWARTHSVRAFALSLVLLAAVIGVVRYDLATWDTTPLRLAPLVGEEVRIIGKVVREPDVRSNTIHVYVATESINDESVTATVLAYVPRFTEVSYSDQIEVTGELQVPESFTTEFGRTFNYPGYLAARGVSHVLFYPEIVIDDSEPPLGVQAQLLYFKAAFLERLAAALPEPENGLAGGILLGTQAGISDSLEADFRRTGIIHIVVLSGYNVMLVVLFVITLASYVLGLRGRLVVGITAIVGFALLVGLTATVMRACIMAAILLIARTFGKTYEALRALLVAGVVMLFINPQLAAFDPGFQLSFLATLGLIVLGPTIESWVRLVPERLGIREFLVATLATQLFLLPFLLFQIGEFSLVSVLVNVLVLPMVPIAMLLSFITGMVGFVTSAGAIYVGYLAYLSLGYIIGIAQWFAALPLAAVGVPVFPWWVMVTAYGVGIVGWWIHRTRTKSDELDEWVVVDAVHMKAGSSLRDEPAEVPVFFRK